MFPSVNAEVVKVKAIKNHTGSSFESANLSSISFLPFCRSRANSGGVVLVFVETFSDSIVYRIEESRAET